MNRFLFLICAATALALINLPATEPVSQTAKKPVSNEYQGTTVEDPYQWLEEDNDPEVKAWSHPQNQQTRDYLDKLPDRANDGPVAPYHSRKMTARLEEATKSDNPILLRTSSSAGHGQGTALSERIKQLADIYSFLFAQLDMSPKEMTKQMTNQAPNAQMTKWGPNILLVIRISLLDICPSSFDFDFRHFFPSCEENC
jgi:hypothetical protein